MTHIPAKVMHQFEAGAVYIPSESLNNHVIMFRDKETNRSLSLELVTMLTIALTPSIHLDYKGWLYDAIVLVTTPDGTTHEVRMINTDNSWRRFDRIC